MLLIRKKKTFPDHSETISFMSFTTLTNIYYMNEWDDEHYTNKNLHHSNDIDIDKYYINR